MKVAIATDDLRTVSAHFGMARHYLVYDIGGEVVRGKEPRDKVGHGASQGGHHHAEGSAGESGGMHVSMLSGVADCDAVVARGMGRPMYEAILAAGKKAFVTRIQLADEAARAFAEGRLDSHPELLH